MRPFRVLAIILALILLSDIGCIAKLEYATAKTKAYIQAMNEKLSSEKP